MRVAEREEDLLPLHVSLITDADDVHLPTETCGHTHDGVICQRARQTVQRRMLIRSTFRAQLFPFEFETNPCGDGRLQRAFWSFHFELLLVDRDSHALGLRDLFFSNSRHNLGPINRSAPTARRLCFRGARLCRSSDL